MTPEQLNELERLANAATPGPWRVCHDEPHIVIDSRFGVDDPDGGIVAECGGKAFHSPFPENAAFIAAARDAVPYLIAEVRRLEEQHRCAVAVAERFYTDIQALRAENGALQAALDAIARHVLVECDLFVEEQLLRVGYTEEQIASMRRPRNTP